MAMRTLQMAYRIIAMIYYITSFMARVYCHRHISNESSVRIL